MGRGFRTVPKALGSEVFKHTMKFFDCSYNDVREDDMRFASEDCAGSIEHVIQVRGSGSLSFEIIF